MLSGVKIWLIESPYSDQMLLGRRARDYILREFAGFDCEIVETAENCRSQGGIIDVYLPLDMPLIEISDVTHGIECIRRRKIGSLSLGKRDSDAKICIAGESESGYFAADARFVKLGGAKNDQIVYNQMRERILRKHLSSEVSIFDLATTHIDDTVKIFPAAVIMPFSRIMGESMIDSGAVIDAAYIEDCVIEGGANVQMSHLVRSRVGACATVGPFARLRDAVISEGCRIGDFVEVKASLLHEGVKAAHLTYIGDAEVGERTNIGCGTVFCNYDGKNKHRTSIGDNCFLGANTNLVAPVNVGDNAFIAAGTTITKDVGDGTFTIGRVRQETKNKNMRE